MKSNGIFFYVRNVKTNCIWKTNYDFKDIDSSKYEVKFSEDKAKFTKIKDNIETETSIITAEIPGVEIRSLRLKNNSNEEESLEISAI